MLQITDPGPQGPPPLRPLGSYAGSLSARVHACLKEAILDLRFGPGEMLRKGEICAQLGVSRAPVSEAFARLAAEGLVDVIPQAGSFVARFSMPEIREGAFLREALECAAVEEAAPRLTDAQIAQIARSIRLQEMLMAEGDAAAFYAEDMAMHETLMGFTGFRRIAQLAQTSWLHVNRARRLILPQPGRIADTIAEHRAILAALEARDPQAARAAMRAHLRKLLTFIEPLAQSRPDLFA